VESITERIVKENSFPPRSRDFEELRFSYYNRRRIFRKKNTIASLDYPGEKITGGPNEAGIAEELSVYYERYLEDQGVIDQLRDVVLRVFLGEENNWVTHEERDDTDNLGRQLYSADVIVFTIPLEDFLANAIKDGHSPPAYSGIAIIEQDSDKMRVTQGGETFTLEEEDGTLYRTDTGEQVDPGFKSPETAHQVDENRWYHPALERRDPVEYMQEFDRVVQQLADEGNREFIWNVTMTDVGIEHFNDAYKDTVNEQSSDGRFEFLREKGFFRHTTPSPETNMSDYKLLSKWIQQEFITSEITVFNKMMHDSHEEYVYPVWFDIAGTDEDRRPVINTKNGRTLRCSHHLLKRLEESTLDDGFVFSHPDYSFTELVRMQLTPISQFSIPSPAELAREKMHQTFSIQQDNAARGDGD